MSRDGIRGLARAIGALAFAAVLAGATVSGAWAAQSVGGPVVSTTDGTVQGVATATSNEFLGIPYAAPPTGALRWQPPQPAAHWPGMRQATAFAPHCAQPAVAVGSDPSTSEDCLYLNVFTPSRQAGRLPVMVWIHGGSLVSGASDLYDPTDLVRDGAIVVTINYRLGALGFLAHPALTDASGGASGDFGLMDQQAALRWVRRNIGQFGGDTGNVTIFGESAGGLSVLAQLASSGAHGLFERAIVESGSYNPTQMSLADAEESGKAFAIKVGCPDQTAACLRNVPVSTIIADEDQSGYTPDIDGRVLARSLSSAFATGQFNRVPVVDGTNHDEWRLFVAAETLAGEPITAANYPSQIEGTLDVTPAQAATIAAKYPLSAYPSAALALGAVGTDAIFACNALVMDSSLSQFVPTFAYEFNDPNPPQVLLPPVDFPLGDYHASETLYLFDVASSELSAGQLILAHTMRGYWTGFARWGEPISTGAPSWPSFTASRQSTQSLTEPQPAVQSDFAAAHNCAFWAPFGISVSV